MNRPFRVPTSTTTWDIEAPFEAVAVRSISSDERASGISTPRPAKTHRSHRKFTKPWLTAPVQRLKRLFAGGSAGNEQLTAAVAAVLIVLLAVEGATLLNLRSLLTVHVFVGMLLIPVIGLKLASTGWRMLRYYRRGEEYVRRGPPHLVLRVLVAPVLVASTLFVFAT